MESKVAADVPQVEKLSESLLKSERATNERRNKSLFAQSLEMKGKLKSFYPLNSITQPLDSKLNNNENLAELEKNIHINKQMITGEGLGNKSDVKRIHLENLQRLASMKPDEILEEQTRLLNQLDPRLVSFIRRKANNNNKSADDARTQLISKQSKTSVPGRDGEMRDIYDELPFKPDKRWLHMDKIEYEKLEWMMKKPRDILVNKSGDSSSSSSYSSARFDFAGKLIDPSEQFPVTEALHHHGNEPESAGYALDELFQLARSKFNQQRVIALQTLANVIANCQLGLYHGVIRAATINTESNKINVEENIDDSEDQNNLLNQLVDGGVLFLLRWNLDESTESIINASLNAIRNLLQPPEQEETFDRVYDLYKGCELTCLHSFSAYFDEKRLPFKLDKTLNVSEQRELNEMDDAEFIRHDLVRGLLRMNFLLRVNYLLDKYKEGIYADSMMQSIFHILYRLVRHSADISYELVEKHSSIVDSIVQRCLPLYIDLNVSDEDGINRLHALVLNAMAALKLFRLLASAGSHLSLTLWKKYKLNERLLNYMAMNYCWTMSDKRTGQGMIGLKIEVIRLLRVSCLYSGDEAAPVGLVTNELYETILKDFNFLIGQIISKIDTVNKNSTHNELNEQAIEANQHLATYLNSLIALIHSLALTIDENDKHIIVKYEMCSSALAIVLSFCKQSFEFLLASNTSNERAKMILASRALKFQSLSICLHFIIDFIEKCSQISYYTVNLALMNRDYVDLQKRIELIELLIEKLIRPLLEDEKVRLKLDDLLMSKMIAYSTCSEANALEFERIKANNLSFLPTICNIFKIRVKEDETYHQLNIDDYPFPFLASLMRLNLVCIKYKLYSPTLSASTSIHNNKLWLSRSLLNNSYLKSYLKLFVKNNSQSRDSLNNCYIQTRQECFFVYYCLKLAFGAYNFEVK
jgi:hypothetical protein